MSSLRVIDTNLRHFARVGWGSSLRINHFPVPPGRKDQTLNVYTTTLVFGYAFEKITGYRLTKNEMIRSKNETADSKWKKVKWEQWIWRGADLNRRQFAQKSSFHPKGALCELTNWAGRILIKPFRWPPRTTCTRTTLASARYGQTKAFVLPFSSRGWRWWTRYIIRLSFSSARKIPAWLFFCHIGLRCMCLSQYVG